MTSVSVAPAARAPSLDFSDMQRFPNTKTINSRPVQLFPLLLDGNQMRVSGDHGLVWWTKDTAAVGGKRVIFERVETDVVTGGDKVDENKKAVTYFEDVYMRANGKHMHCMRRYRNAEEQTISNLVSQGGNSMPQDLYLQKGMHWCTPEEYVSFQVQSELNAALHDAAKRAADPKRDMARLADLIAESMSTKRPAGNVQDALAAAAAEDKAAAEAERKAESTKTPPAKTGK